MTRFTRLETEPDAAAAIAEAWLRARLDHELTERRLAGAYAWSIERGRREAGPAGGPRLAQTGFRIHIVDQPAGTERALACFVTLEDIHDEEQRGVVEQVLALWMDRALEES